MIAIGRRAVLGASVASLSVLAASPALAVRGPLADEASVMRAQRRLRDPFTLGVASGDPEPDGVLIWTRLAPHPLAVDGLGGMPRRAVLVEWQVAEDRDFARLSRTGSIYARPESAHSVHVEVDGLAPDREYFYRFRAAGHPSMTGRTRTAPPYASSPSSLTVAVASCAQYEHGYFTAYRRIAEENPDLVLHLGDYMYEFRKDDYVAYPHNVRAFAGHETVSLADYRRRHAQYKTDPGLQAAHAAAPWSVVFDDHEVDGNWAGMRPEHRQPHFGHRRAAAFRAYYENMPLRRTSVPRGMDMQIYRRVRWGDLATLHLMDTRQYRDDQACGDHRQAGCSARLDPRRSITGDRQERWLLRGLGDSDARWDVLAQQVFFAQRDTSRQPGLQVGMDGWDGYAASRHRILDDFGHRNVRNPVVLTGDVHRHYANDLRLDFDRPDTRPVGVELVTSSVTSGGDGHDMTDEVRGELAENPHIRFASCRRGYVVARFDRDQLRAEFKTLPYVQRMGAPVSTAAAFVVEDGNPGLQRA